MVLALLFKEARATEAADLLNQHAAALHMSSVNVAETLMRLRSQVDHSRLTRTIKAFGKMPIKTVSADRAHAELAAAARFRYPRLNFGGCFAYATAKLQKMPLLTFDADFAAVDVEVVGLQTEPGD